MNNMLAIFRIIILFFFTIIICLFGCCYCLFSPRNPKHVMKFAHLFGKLSYLFGVTIIKRISPDIKNYGPSIYISNHQNNYDMITLSNVVQKNTVTIGKKSLIYIPLFGQLYWLTGNILINRNNKMKAYNTIIQIINKIKKQNISVLMFPEGKRSYKSKLLPFKIGAFYIAITAGVPIIPICLSTTEGEGSIKLNKWNNGKVIIEILSPIDTKLYNRKNAHKLAQYCYNLIDTKIKELNQEITKIK